MKKKSVKKKPVKVFVLLLIIGLLVVVCYIIFRHNNTSTSTKSQTNTSNSTKSNQTTSSSFNKSQYSLTDPSSIWVIVNKQHPLNPISYAPTDLVVPSVPLRVPGNETMQVRAVTASALEQMFAAAKTQGIELMLASGYRSYSYQASLYSGYVQNMGIVDADASSARPGYSEHQTGFAADLEPVSRNCELEQCFGTTPEGEWLAAHAYQYGFIIRYTAGNQSITGYEPEPWHVRYVGTSLSTELHNTGIQTLEQFFGVSGGTVYKSP
jgi:D-alanyl-D-alanine carboxypeptidase